MNTGDHAPFHFPSPARHNGQPGQRTAPAARLLARRINHPPFPPHRQALVLGTLMAALLTGCGEGAHTGTGADAASTPKAAAASATDTTATSTSNAANTAPQPGTSPDKASGVETTAPRTKADEEVVLPTAADAPFNGDGVSGELFSAMLLDAWSDRGFAAAQMPPYASAVDFQQRNAEQPPALPDPAIPRVSVQQRLIGNQYLDGKTEGGYSPAVGSFTLQQNSGTWVDAQQPTVSYPLHSRMDLGLPVTNERNGDDGSLTLGQKLSLTPLITSATNTAGTSLRFSLDWRHPEDGSTIGHKSRVAWWTFDENDLPEPLSWYTTQGTAPAGSTVEIVVNKPREANRPELCWNIYVVGIDRNMYRTICTTWEVPQNWTYGQPLKFVRQVITERPAVYAGNPNPLSRLFAWSTKRQ